MNKNQLQMYKNQNEPRLKVQDENEYFESIMTKMS